MNIHCVANMYNKGRGLSSEGIRRARPRKGGRDECDGGESVQESLRSDEGQSFQQ
jgi:hypothetical protein